uniref:C2H2-type domain-containing protein n=1 Tax=Trichuris muris TaxID=70415 RepID=A0A5S6QB05_TRIMR
MPAAAGTKEDESCPCSAPALFTGHQLPVIPEALSEGCTSSTASSVDCSITQNAGARQTNPSSTLESPATTKESPHNGIITLEGTLTPIAARRNDFDLDSTRSQAILGWIGYSSDNGVAYVFECCDDLSGKGINKNFGQNLIQHAARTLSCEAIGSAPTGPIAYLRHWKWTAAQTSSGDGYELQERRHFKLLPFEKASACEYPSRRLDDQCIFLCLLCKIRFLRAPSFFDHCSTRHKLREHEHRTSFTGISASAVLLPDFGNGGAPLLFCMESAPWSRCTNELAKDDDDDDDEVSKSVPAPCGAALTEIPLVKSKSEHEKGYQETIARKSFGLSNGQAGYTFKHCDTSTNSISPEHSLSTSVSSPYSPRAVASANFAGLQPVPSSATLSQSRNSAKTLKCPKCNWHYKYHETLEIHMKEKHPDNEVSCVYCLTSQPHPRLARGENYVCGYKPYRCDICRYSTTTKGNLAIHMQSDKHLNNAREIHQAQFLSGRDADLNSPHVAAVVGILPCKSPPCVPAVSGPLPVDEHLPTLSYPSSSKKGPIFRCDICNYETCIARNLRIHMTSEKHSQNSVILNQHSASTFEQCNGLTMDRVAAKLLDWATSAPAQSDIHNYISTGSTVNEREDGEMLAQFAEKPESLPACFDADGTMRPFQCCICLDFTCESVEEIVKHVSSDRTQPNDSDVSHLAGNYVCNLCQYKTQLKANFTLHVKTEKHLQRLQLMNHIHEGSVLKEWRLQFLNHSSPVQLRCVACNEFCDNLYKLQLHVTSSRHKYCLRALEKVRNGPHSSHGGQPDASEFASDLRIRDQRALYCVLCRFGTTERERMFGHLLSTEHQQAVNEVLASMEINPTRVGAKLSDQDSSEMPDWIEERPCGRDGEPSLPPPPPALGFEAAENGKPYRSPSGGWPSRKRIN